MTFCVFAAAYKPVSTTQDLYNSSEQNQLDPYKVAKVQMENAKLVEQSRNSNFTLNMSENRPAKMSNTTSAGQAYTPEKLALKDMAQVGNAQVMRVANFKMGFERQTDYGTTTD